MTAARPSRREECGDGEKRTERLENLRYGGHWGVGIFG